MISQKKLDNYYKIAKAMAELSPDQQTKVGAILIHPKSFAIISNGYNGFVRGAPDEILPRTRPDKHKFIQHSETNLICNAAKHGIKTDGCIVFCTLSPCKKCLRILYQAGISIVYFKDKYSDYEENLSMQDLDVSEFPIGEYFKIEVRPKNG